MKFKKLSPFQMQIDKLMSCFPFSDGSPSVAVMQC